MSTSGHDEWAVVAEAFGGTALSRTHLADARLSEDVDLIALGPRSEVAEHVESSVRRGLARSHGRPVWHPALRDTTGSRPAVLSVEGPVSVQIQLLSGTGHRWPTEVRDVVQRYSDAPPARLRTFTAAGFAAAELRAWLDRRAPRDLYDLWALAERGLIGAEALDVFVHHGPQATPPASRVFDAAPDESAWRRALGAPDAVAGHERGGAVCGPCCLALRRTGVVLRPLTPQGIAGRPRRRWSARPIPRSPPGTGGG